jgi:phytoene desaturase
MAQLHEYDVIVIGAGLAGLAASIRLRKEGKSVLVLEKSDKPGGKLDEFSWKEYRWDKGPSLFTEPHLIDELFELCGKDPRDYYDYKSLSESCRYFFNDKNPIVFYRNKEQLSKELAAIASTDEIQRMEDYLQESESFYNSIGDFFLSNSKPGLKDVFKIEMLKRYPKFLKQQMLTTLNGFNNKRLKNPKLVQIFNRYGTYNGSNPFAMSGLYSMIPHLEMNQGAFFPTKGMRSIVLALQKLAKEEGVEILCNESSVVRPKNDGFDVMCSKNFHANQLVCAIDHLTFYKNVIKDTDSFASYKKQERSTSALVFYFAINKSFTSLDLHNIFFSNNYEEEFDHLFNKKVIPTDPTYYVHISSKSCENDAPKDCENWFVMVNMPAGVTPNQTQRESIKKQFFIRMSTHLETNIEDHIVHEEFWDSESIQMDTGSFQGALYGPSSNSTLSALTRHDNSSKKYKDLYFCGGTVHPGGGIPLVMRSAKIVSNLMK